MGIILMTMVMKRIRNILVINKFKNLNHIKWLRQLISILLKKRKEKNERKSKIKEIYYLFWMTMMISDNPSKF